MPYDISIEDINDNSPSGASNAEITMLISMISAADACLTARAVPEELGRTLKIYGVRHLLALSANGGAGAVTQQSSASGAGRSFAGWTAGRGISSTAFGGMLAQLDRFGCVTSLLNSDAGVFIASTGPSRCRT